MLNYIKNTRHIFLNKCLKNKSTLFIYLKIDYENESLEVMNDFENFLKNPNFIGFSDICFKISESIKVSLNEKIKRNKKKRS